MILVRKVELYEKTFPKTTSKSSDPTWIGFAKAIFVSDLGCDNDNTKTMGNKSGKNGGPGGDNFDASIIPVSAGSASSYAPNEIREIQINDDFSILVSQIDGKFYAFGSKCPHRGADLRKGVLVDGMIRCAWHGSCYDIRTGDIEDHPGTWCLPTYDIKKKRNGQLMVYPENPGVSQVDRPLGGISNPKRIIVAIGGGAAGFTFAKTLRELRYNGRIIIISKDCHLPYDRTRVSKEPGVTWDEVKLRPTNWYSDARVEVVLNASVRSVNLSKKHIVLEGVETPIPYEKLLIASGLAPRRPVAPGEETNMFKGIFSGIIRGAHLRNVLTLHTLKDSLRIREKAKGKRMVIVGSGFTGMELASSMQPIAEHITIITRDKRPYSAVFGEVVGRMIQQRIIGKHKNITFRSCDIVRQLNGDAENKVTEVITLKKASIPCEVVVFCIGGIPATEFLLNPYRLRSWGIDQRPTKSLPLNVTAKGFIPVNEFMQTSDPDVLAAGDIAKIPLNASVSQFAVVGHWGMAEKMGRLAAMAAMDKKESILDSVPFFWTVVSGVSIRYVGYGQYYNKSYIFGDLSDHRFCVVYKRQNKIIAVCTANCDPIAAKVAFDIEDDVDFGDEFPDYITDAFTKPPITGEIMEGIKFNDDEDFIVDFDAHNLKLKDLSIERRQKMFNNNPQYKDMEYKVVIPKNIMDQSHMIFKSHFNQLKAKGIKHYPPETSQEYHAMKNLYQKKSSALQELMNTKSKSKPAALKKLGGNQKSQVQKKTSKTK